MLEDDELAKAAAAGNAAAFTILVERYEKSLRNMLNRVAGVDGDDLAQDAFARAWRLASSYRGGGRYRAWLFRIAWRIFLDSRGRKREGTEFEADSHGASSTPDPTVSMDLERAFAQLSARERAAAVLCFGEGFSHQEAATALRLPLGTLKSIAARAREKLVAYLEVANHG